MTVGECIRRLWGFIILVVALSLGRLLVITDVKTERVVRACMSDRARSGQWCTDGDTAALPLDVEYWRRENNGVAFV